MKRKVALQEKYFYQRVIGLSVPKYFLHRHNSRPPCIQNNVYSSQSVETRRFTKKSRCFVTFRKKISRYRSRNYQCLSPPSLSSSLQGQTGCINAFEVAKVVCKQMEKVYTEFKRPWDSGRLAGGK